MFENSVITNAGAKLLEQWVGGGSLKIDRAAAGTGTVPASTLPGCTSLANEVQEVSLMSKIWAESGLQLHLQFTQTEQDYRVNQVGIWAHIEGGEEVSDQSALFAIFQDDVGFEIPSTQMKDFAFAFYAMIATDNKGSITINYDQTAFLPRSVLEEVEQDLTELSDQAVKQMQDLLQRAATPLYMLTVPAEGWELDEAGDGRYWVTLPLESVKAGDSIAVDVVQLGQAEADELALEHWAMVRRAVVNDGSITLRATEAPESQYQIQLKVIL